MKYFLVAKSAVCNEGFNDVQTYPSLCFCKLEMEKFRLHYIDHVSYMSLTG